MSVKEMEKSEDYYQESQEEEKKAKGKQAN